MFGLKCRDQIIYEEITNAITEKKRKQHRDDNMANIVTLTELIKVDMQDEIRLNGEKFLGRPALMRSLEQSFFA